VNSYDWGKENMQTLGYSAGNMRTCKISICVSVEELTFTGIKKLNTTKK